MNKRIIAAAILALPLAMMAQTAIDAYQLSRYDLRGTARFMSMGGAFTALGGDLSTLGQNPAGIGVYRKSEVGITADIDIQGTKTITPTGSFNNDQTKAYCTNLGYVGSFYTGLDIMPYFQFGFNYGRAASFDRRYKGTNGAMNASLTSYLAGYTNTEKWSTYDLSVDCYNNGYAPWLSILGYNGFIINAIEGSTSYTPLWGDSTTGSSTFDVEEKGYVDEYNINFGGNFTDIVYWGIGLGITDIEYTQRAYYGENMRNTNTPNLEIRNQYVDETGEIVNCPPYLDSNGTYQSGNGSFGLSNYKHISGTGFNFKVGLIVRPIEQLRIGLAVHTPTYYNLDQNSFGDLDYDYSTMPATATPGMKYTGTPEYNVSYKIRTPWRLMLGVAGVIGSKGIVSLDYEYRPYQNMTVKSDAGFNYENPSFDPNADLKGDIKSYYDAAHIIRLGAEYRISPQFSVRAGFAYESTPTSATVREGRDMVYTSNPDDTGTNPAYTLDNQAVYYTAGLGWHHNGFYADAAYVHKYRSSTYHPFTPNTYTADPASSKVEMSSNNIVISVGYKF